MTNQSQPPTPENQAEARERQRCPITRRLWFMDIEHDDLGVVPTYGGPFDSYTVPEVDEDGHLRCERYDHDAGMWIEGGEPLNVYLTTEQPCNHELPRWLERHYREPEIACPHKHADLLQQPATSERCVFCGHAGSVDALGVCGAVVPVAGLPRRDRYCLCKCVYPATGAPAGFDVDGLVFQFQCAAIQRHVLEPAHDAPWSDCDFAACAQARETLVRYYDCAATGAGEEAQRECPKCHHDLKYLKEGEPTSEGKPTCGHGRGYNDPCGCLCASPTAKYQQRAFDVTELLPSTPDGRICECRCHGYHEVRAVRCAHCATSPAPVAEEEPHPLDVAIKEAEDDLRRVAPAMFRDGVPAQVPVVETPQDELNEVTGQLRESISFFQRYMKEGDDLCSAVGGGVTIRVTKRGPSTTTTSEAARETTQALSAAGYLDRDLYVKVSNARLEKVAAIISAHLPDAAPRHFCSCGGALTAEEYIVHYFEKGHDRGEGVRPDAKEAEQLRKERDSILGSYQSLIADSGQYLKDNRQLRAELSTARANIDAFWLALERSWEIEPRSYFEKEAPENGFGSPLAMAVHHMWKRDTNTEEARANAIREAVDATSASFRAVKENFIPVNRAMEVSAAALQSLLDKKEGEDA
jgi:hypothetical protein